MPVGKWGFSMIIKLGSISAINIGLGFMTQWVILTFLGPNNSTDALFAGMVIPQLILSVVSGSLTHVLVPIFSTKEKEQRQSDAWQIIIGLGLIFTFICVILYIFADLWIPIITPGFDKETLNLATTLTRIQLISMVFTALTSVLWSVYHAQQKFLWVEISAALINSVAIVLLVYLLPKYGIYSAAWVSMLKTAAMFIILFPEIGLYKRRMKNKGSFLEIWKRIKPLLLGTVYYKTDTLVDRYLLSSGPSGGISLFYVAQQVFGAASTIFNKAVATPILPKLSLLAKENNWDEFSKLYTKKLKIIVIFFLFGLIAFYFVGEYVLDLAFSFGKMNENHIKFLWWIMLLLFGYWAGGMLGQILSISFYAIGNTKTPTIIGVSGYTLGMILKIAGFVNFGIIGVAVATSIYYMINASALYLSLKKEVALNVRNKN